MIEIETRTPIKDVISARKKLEDYGFIFQEEYEQEDITIDNTEASLFRSGQKIRIRKEKGLGELTYKGKFKEGDLSQRVELNIPVGVDKINDFSLFLKCLGFKELFRVSKRRIKYKKGLVTATIDIWPIIDPLLELEGPEDLLREITSNFIEYKFDNYRLKTLFEEKIKETGKSLESLKEEYLKNSGNDIGNIEAIF